MATLRISFKKLPRRLNLLIGSRLYYKKITCEKKKILPFVQSDSNPAVASPKEQHYEQMTSNPAFTERNIQKANAYLLCSRQQQKSLVTFHTLQSLYVCVWLVNTDFNYADLISDNLHVISSRYLRTMGEKFIFQFSRRSWGRNA